MIFHTSNPPRFLSDQSHLEIIHKIVIDDDDMNLMTPEEIGSYFPRVRPGFKRVKILQCHDDMSSHVAFVVVDHEVDFMRN